MQFKYAIIARYFYKRVYIRKIINNKILKRAKYNYRIGRYFLAFFIILVNIVSNK